MHRTHKREMGDNSAVVGKRSGVHARHPRFAAERQQYQSLGRPSAALAAMGHPRIDARGRVSPLFRSRAAGGGPRPEQREEFAFRMARSTDLGRRVAAVTSTLCPRLRLCCRSAAKRGESIAPRRIHERIGGREILPNVSTFLWDLSSGGAARQEGFASGRIGH